MICPFHVAVSKLDNVYRSATAMKLCTVALWLPEAFLAIHACLTGFWKSSLEASYMFMLQMLVWPGLCPRCSCGCSWKCSALQKCLWLRGARCILMLQVPALALLSSPAQEELCPHSTDLIHLQERAQGDQVGLMQEQRLLDTLASWFSRRVASSHYLAQEFSRM